MQNPRNRQDLEHCCLKLLKESFLPATPQQTWSILLSSIHFHPTKCMLFGKIYLFIGNSNIFNLYCYVVFTKQLACLKFEVWLVFHLISLIQFHVVYWLFKNLDNTGDDKCQIFTSSIYNVLVVAKSIVRDIYCHIVLFFTNNRFVQILGCEAFQAFADVEIRGDIIRHNLTLTDKCGIVIVPNPAENAPPWLLEAMKTLASCKLLNTDCVYLFISF